MRHASMTAHDYFVNAISDIDEQFGDTPKHIQI
jgi:hypothetical protein